MKWQEFIVILQDYRKGQYSTHDMMTFAGWYCDSRNDGNALVLRLRELYAQKLSEAEQMVATTPLGDLDLTENNKQLRAIETVLQMMGEPPPVA